MIKNLVYQEKKETKNEIVSICYVCCNCNIQGQTLWSRVALFTIFCHFNDLLKL